MTMRQFLYPTLVASSLLLLGSLPAVAQGSETARLKSTLVSGKSGTRGVTPAAGGAEISKGLAGKGGGEREVGEKQWDIVGDMPKNAPGPEETGVSAPLNTAALTLDPVPPPAPPPITRDLGGGAGLPERIDGEARVVDTATLLVAGREVKIYGLQGTGGPAVTGMAGYLNSQGNRVFCQLIPDSAAYRCRVPSNQDLAVVALFNGAARATVDAPMEYHNQESAARQGKRGIWSGR